MKSNFKLIIGIIIGFILSSGVVYAVTLYQAKEVAYDNSSSGSTSTDVQSAIDELYQMASNYIDVSGANSPVLLDNMVPIKNNGSYWEVADLKDEWYNYDKKLWANAVVLKEEVGVGEEVTEENIDLWLVWIPRYKYQLFNANNGSVNPLEIQIEFESGTETTGTVRCVDNISGSGDSSETCTNASNGNWYTHPAFTFGEEELTGIWVGKFEVSGTVDKITTIPNVSSLRNQTLSSFFNAILKVKDTYGINGDSHMMKNMEWGAVAYLSHSKYGIDREININNNSSHITGSSSLLTLQQGTYPGTYGNGASYNEPYNTEIGYLASTTGNISGIYDMSGGAYEYMSAYISGYYGSSGFNITNIQNYNDKYFDIYLTNGGITNYENRILGDAIGEMGPFVGYADGDGAARWHNKWYNDIGEFSFSSFPWLGRSGIFSYGLITSQFYFNRSTGAAAADQSFRLVLSPKN